jgi:transcriptional regulator with XRE-family HTH domain
MAHWKEFRPEEEPAQAGSPHALAYQAPKGGRYSFEIPVEPAVAVEAMPAESVEAFEVPIAEYVGGAEPDLNATIAEEARNVDILRQRVQARAAENSDARTFGWIALVGAALRRARDACDLTQTVLSQKTSITQGYLSSVETGKLVRGPTIDVLYRYAAALNCDCEIVFRDRKSGHVVTNVQSAEITGSAASEEAAVSAPPY